MQKNGLPAKCNVVINVAGENELNPAKRYGAAFDCSVTIGTK